MLSMFYAAVLALIYVGLSLYVVKGRWQHRAALGHGPDSVLERRVRMHGNFAEYVPIALILLFMLDVAKFPPLGVPIPPGFSLHNLDIHPTRHRRHHIRLVSWPME